jgi:hypothetical protein
VIPDVEAVIGAVVAVLQVRQARAFTAEPIRAVMGAWLVTHFKAFGRELRRASPLSVRASNAFPQCKMISG